MEVVIYDKLDCIYIDRSLVDVLKGAFPIHILFKTLLNIWIFDSESSLKYCDCVSSNLIDMKATSPERRKYA